MFLREISSITSDFLIHNLNSWILDSVIQNLGYYLATSHPNPLHPTTLSQALDYFSLWQKAYSDCSLVFKKMRWITNIGICSLHLIVKSISTWRKSKKSGIELLPKWWLGEWKPFKKNNDDGMLGWRTTVVE